MNKQQPKHVLAAALLALGLAAPLQARAQTSDAGPLTASAVTRAAVRANPTLRASLLDARRAEIALQAEEARRTASVSADAGITRGTSASLGQDGSVRLVSQNRFVASAGVDYTFDPGTQLSAKLSTNRTVQDNAFFGNLGTTYGLNLSVEVVQPLLQGRGSAITNASIATARAQKTSAQETRDRAASALLRDVLVAYWELWYAHQALKVSESGLKLAKEQLEVGQVRVNAGAIAQEELLPLQTEVAQLEEEVFSATATIRDRSIALSRLLGAPSAQAITTSDDAPTARDLLALEEAHKRAEDRSPALKQLRADMEASRVQLMLAEDRQRMRLDGVASLQVVGLGTGVGSTISQLATFDATVFFLGVRFSRPWSLEAQRDDASRAQLTIDAAAARYAATRDQLRADVASRHTSLAIATERLRLAQRTLELSRATVEQQRVKFQAGSVTALDVVRVLQQQRQAELRVLRARVDLANGATQLDDLTGALLDRDEVRTMRL